MLFRPLPAEKPADKQGQPVDMAELMPNTLVDNDCSQRLALDVSRELRTRTAGVIYRSNLVITGSRGSGISTVVDAMLKGHIPGADLSGPSVLRVQLAGNMTIFSVFSAIAQARHNLLNIQVTKHRAIYKMQAALREGLLNNEIRTLVFSHGDLAITMDQERSEAFMTTLNSLLNQAKCCAVIEASTDAKDRYMKCATGQKRFVAVEITPFQTSKEIARYCNNWDDLIKTTRWKGLPWGNSFAGIQGLPARLFNETDRSLAAVTDALKRAVLLATMNKKPLSDLDFDEALN